MVNADSRTLKLRSPKSLLHSPRFHDPITNQVYVRSPSLKDLTPSIIDSEDQLVNDVQKIIKEQERSQWFLGLIYLFGLVSTWIVAVQISNNVMKRTQYDHPFIMAYTTGSFFFVFGFWTMVKDLFSRIKKYYRKSNGKLNIQNNTYGTVDPNANNEQIDNDSQIILVETPNVQLSYKDMVILGSTAAFFYYINCLLGTMCLRYTSASNQTILATTSSFFSLIVSVFVKIEKLTIGKIISIIISIIGVLCITLSSSENVAVKMEKAMLGDIMAVVGAFCYSCFLVVLRLKLGEETDSEKDKIVYGYIGLTTLVFGYPLLLIVDKLGFEPLELPQDINIFYMILLAAFLGSLSDYCGSVASLLTSPLLTSLSLSTAIPISMICDSFFYGGANLSIWYFTGIILIFTSFIFTNVSNEKEIVQEAIEEAIEEAIQHDELLTPLLSPMAPSLTQVMDIPSLSIDQNVTEQQLVITGGHNHKYFIRDIHNHH